MSPISSVGAPAGSRRCPGFVLPAIVLAAPHWRELAANAAERTLAADNLLLIALCYPVLKALHELGHGYAVKSNGGAVHEIGVMFLVFAPVPYVDASAASEFREQVAARIRRRRRHDCGSLRRRFGALRLARGRARICQGACLQRHVDRRGRDRALQRQSAPATAFARSMPPATSGSAPTRRSRPPLPGRRRL